MLGTWKEGPRGSAFYQPPLVEEGFTVQRDSQCKLFSSPRTDDPGLEGPPPWTAVGRWRNFAVARDPGVVTTMPSLGRGKIQIHGHPRCAPPDPGAASAWTVLGLSRNCPVQGHSSSMTIMPFSLDCSPQPDLSEAGVSTEAQGVGSLPGEKGFNNRVRHQHQPCQPPVLDVRRPFGFISSSPSHGGSQVVGASEMSQGLTQVMQPESGKARP